MWGMNADFSKPYDPKLIEEKIYQMWLDSGYFNPDNLPVTKVRNSKFEIRNFVVYMPLPNVTGTLHMGHALNNTIQDILIRYHRMRGFKTLWFPGTDHAGIATQYVVEKELRKQNISRWELGREKFIEKVWEWKKKYGDIILDQLKKIGISADWSRVRFTMDEEYSRDVLEAFVHYHEKGWLYRGLRTVNWCPKDGTSLSELELEYEDAETKLWYIKYLISNEEFRISKGAEKINQSEIDSKFKIQNSKFVVVATTRPETMLGDTAIAVNPTDKRYKRLIGKSVTLPIQNREIPIVGDIAIDPKFGTGAVKVTPAHDVLDFEIGQQHKLETIQVIDERAKMTAAAGKYAGLKVIEARERIVNDLKGMGLIVKEEAYQNRVAKCYRCGTIIEPIPSNQWFLKMGALGKMAKQAVKKKKVRIRPKNFEKTYLNWLENVRDWSVSRQIWWGHRLPVYFCKNKPEELTSDEFRISNEIKKINHSEIDSKSETLLRPRAQDRGENSKFVVSIEKPAICPFCKNCDMERSQDVLDTWFSSALWPFAGLSKDDSKNYYPGNALITARDIINLWVARMIFSGLEFRKKVPFTDVFINGTILAKDGKRMSKSLGTGVDPLNYIDRFGADATRFGLIWQASGQDIRWDEAAVTAGRKFGNKIWNASRFVIEQNKDLDPSAESKLSGGSASMPLRALGGKTAADKKILRSLAKTKKQTEKMIENFEFSEALHLIYDFFWHDFCDKYIEEAKRQLTTDNLRLTTKNILTYVLQESLKTLHPFMPFITEAVYQELPIEGKNLLIVETW